MRTPEGSFSYLSEVEERIAAEAEERISQEAQIRDAYSDESLRAEADAMNEVFDANVRNEEFKHRQFEKKVANLNNKTELEIFGTRGRTEGYKDPATGAPLVKPIKGIVDQMRENPRFGTTQKERDVAADKYVGDVDKLIGEGFELSQAKVVMDLRAESQDNIDIDLRKHNRLIGKLTGQYMDKGFDETEALMLAKQRLTPPKASFDDDKIKKWVRKNNMYSLDPSEDPTKEVVLPKAPELVSYKEDKDGNVSYGAIITETGFTLPWGKIDEASRVGILNWEDNNQWLVLRDKVYDLSKLASGEDPLVLGEAGETTEDDIIGEDGLVSIEVPVEASGIPESKLSQFKSSDQENPFKKAEADIEKYYAEKAKNATPAKVAFGGLKRMFKKFKEYRDDKIVYDKSQFAPDETIEIRKDKMGKDIKNYLSENGYKKDKHNTTAMWDAVEAKINELPDDYDGDIDKLKLNIADGLDKKLSKRRFL